MRIRVQILEVDSGQHVWSDQFDRAPDDYLGIQDDVARAIASAVRVKLTSEDEARLAPPPSVDPEIGRAHV